MFSDRIDWIDWIFHGFQMKPRKRNSAQAEERAEESTRQKHLVYPVILSKY